jgi:hypothetical protein
MKKAAISVVFIVGIVLGLSMTAMAAGGGGNSVWVKVPFAFYAGRTLMPAGTYLMSLGNDPFATGKILRIQNQDGTIFEQVNTIRTDGNSAASNIQVFFTKYGDTHFLSQVKGNDYGVELTKSTAEKQAIAASAKPKASPASAPASPSVK